MAQSLLSASWSGARFISSKSAGVSYSVPIFLAPNVVCSRTHLRQRARKVQLATLSFRYNSTTSATTLDKVKEQEEILSQAVSPPASFYPPILESPERHADQSLPSYLFALGKSYVTFYKNGLWAVKSNYDKAKDIRQQKLGDGMVDMDDGLRNGRITRAEWQLSRRAKKDVRKIPVFGLVLLIFGEFTPLVVLAISAVVPSTCRIPRQQKAETEGLEKRRSTSFKQGDSVLSTEELEQGAKLLQLHKTEDVVKQLRWEQLLHISRSLGLYAKSWDTFWDYPPQWILKKRVQRALDYIKLDDSGIARGGGAKWLDSAALRMAAEERGLDTLGKSDEDLTLVLRKWFQAKEKQSIPYLILTRPNVWKT